MKQTAMIPKSVRFTSEQKNELDRIAKEMSRKSPVPVDMCAVVRLAVDAMIGACRRKLARGKR